MSDLKQSPIQASLDDASWLTRSLPIRLFGDPALTAICEPVTPDDIKSGHAAEWAKQLINFLEAYRLKKGVGRGLAANQLGIRKQMLLTWSDSGPQIYLNPRVSNTKGQAVYPEACISAASLIIGDVTRPWSATITYTTLEGQEVTIEPDDLLARLLLHEIDHLSGKICSDQYMPGTIRILSGDPDDILKPTLRRTK